MASTALIIGNSHYRSLTELACCRADVLAIKELLEATKKYALIEVLENMDADPLKAGMRAAIDKFSSTSELFFYFTGHGFQHEDEFYLCATNFDSKRPNETGLSTSELHTLLRLVDADLVVKVIDACNSGTLLVKAEGGFASQQKQGFKNLIQISSCLDSQNSLTGDPLSVFTEKFRASALRKHEGPVYYIDIIYALRDEFLQDDNQTPFFVSQGTGREKFVDNAECLAVLRASLTATTIRPPSPSTTEGLHPLPPAPTLQTLLQKAEQKIATAEQVRSFVNTLFDSLIQRVSTSEFAEFFDLEIIEHPDFQERTAEAFMIRVLSKESRPDNFVTATITKKAKKK